ncbi:MAG TPA: nuclear transport factor 2 family protein, partial [bacterium]|nr:nuclear transport factor 2 family protein [bacterium]
IGREEQKKISEISTRVSQQQQQIEKKIRYKQKEIIFPPLSQEALESPKIIIISEGVKRLSPANNSEINTMKPVFEWEEFKGAISYQFYLIKAPYSENNIILYKQVFENKYELSPEELAESLKTDIKYLWLVVALNNDGEIISKVKEGDYYVFTIKSEGKKEEEKKIEIGEVKISEIMINNRSIETLEKIVNMNKDNLIDGKFQISFKISGLENVSQILLSVNDGQTYNELPYSKEQTSSVITYSFIPAASSEYKFKLKIKLINNEIKEENYFSPLEKIVYDNRTNEAIIKELITKLITAIINNDVNSFMECISEDFIGNNKGYTDYNEIKTSITNYFKKTSTISCNYTNLKITIYSENLAQAEFNLKRTISFPDIAKIKNIEAKITFRITKKGDAWKITSEPTGIFFMKYFPQIPSTPF